MAETNNKDRRYTNNVILTSDAFKHLLQNVVIQNRSNGDSKYYYIDNEMKKQSLENLGHITGGSNTPPANLPVYIKIVVDGKDTYFPVNFGTETGSGTGATNKFLRCDGTWSNEITGALKFVDSSTSQNAVIIRNNNNDGIIQKDSNGETIDTEGSFDINSNTVTIKANTSASISTHGGIYAAGNVWGKRIFNAVFNDYAEYRKTCLEAKPGMCVVDNDDGSMRISDGYLLPGAQIISDTFGHAMGMTDKCTTPIAVAGRVLAYPYQDRKNYHAGMCVCSAPGGKVNIMSRKDIQEYPDAIVGIVSEIPEYEYWGTDNIKVDGRIWIKVK